MAQEQEMKEVASSDFLKKPGAYFDQAARGPLVITKHTRRSLVIVDYEEYQRLKSRDTRQAFSSADMPDEHRQAIEGAEWGAVGPTEPAR